MVPGESPLLSIKQGRLGSFVRLLVELRDQAGQETWIVRQKVKLMKLRVLP